MMSRGHAVIPFHKPHKKSMRSRPGASLATVRGQVYHPAAAQPNWWRPAKRRRRRASGLGRPVLLELLALLGAEDVLAQAHRLGRHFDELVVGDPFERTLEGDRARHLEAGVDLFGCCLLYTSPSPRD